MASSSGNGTMCWPTIKDSPLCWWVWLFLILLLLLLCCCCGFMFWRQQRPRVFIRLFKAGTSGHTTEDEMLFTIYVKDDNETIQSIVDKLIEINELPQQVANQLAYDRTLDLFHQQYHCQISNNSCLCDYEIQPLRSNKAKGKTKRLKVIRFERAVIDIRKGLVTNPMSFVNDDDDVEKSLKSKNLGSDSTTIEMTTVATTLIVAPQAAPQAAPQEPDKVELIGAGTHAVDAHYHITTTPTPESNIEEFTSRSTTKILTAYVSPTGYRLHLFQGKMGKDGKKKHNKWKILDPAQKQVLYSVSTAYCARVLQARRWFLGNCFLTFFFYFASLFVFLLFLKFE